MARARRPSFGSAQAAYDNFSKKEVFKAWDYRALSAYVQHGFKSGADGSWQLKCLPEIEARSYLLTDLQKLWPELNKLRADITFVRYG